MTEHNVITITLRELKTRSTEIMKSLEETPSLEIIITRYGKPCAKLVPIGEGSGKPPESERVSLRNTWSHLPELSDADFEEAKRIWGPRANI
jgi:prevent-host-death family protein